MQVLIMVGVAGSGKSRYAKELVSKNTNTLLLSLNEDFLFPSRGDGVKEKEKLHRDLMTAVKSRKYDTIILDSMNLKRKERRGIYSQIKQIGGSDVEVKIVYHSMPLYDILYQNRMKYEGYAISPEYLLKQYLTLQVPRFNADCDSFVVRGIPMFNIPTPSKDKTIATQMIEAGIGSMKGELSRLTESHDSEPHHCETIEEHIEMCVKESRLSQNINLVKIAIFHDLGKSVSKEIIEKDGVKKGTYIGHANVSANYFLNFQAFTSKSFNINDYIIMEAIHQHMNALAGLSPKTIRNNKIDNYTLEYIELFRRIDEVSRVAMINID